MISPSWMTERDDDEEKGEREEEASVDEAESVSTPNEENVSKEKDINERTGLTEGDIGKDEKAVVRRGPVLTFFVAISVLSVMAALMLAVAHAASLYLFISKRRDEESRGAVDIALRAYGLIFCGMVCSIELEIGIEPKNSILSRFWSLRGIFYAFIGLLALDNADSDERRRDGDHHLPAAWRDDSFMPYSLYLRSAAASLLTLGCLYFFLGLCWCQRCKEARHIEYKKQLAQAQVRDAELTQRRNSANSYSILQRNNEDAQTNDHAQNSTRRTPTGKRRPTSAKTSTTGNPSLLPSNQ